MSGLTRRYSEAFDYAAIVHAGQLRKGTSIPYLSHLISVSALVLEHGGDEDLAIAALLHDAAEDQGGQARLDDIRSRFGGRVAEVVGKCSDSLVETGQDKAPWAQRKRAYLEHLRAESDQGFLLVSCADKLHNARAILADYRTHGDGMWSRFTGGGRTRGQIAGYYVALAEAFAAALTRNDCKPLVRELQVTVGHLLDETRVTPDRSWEAA
jgi:(p)ppGpp synthase/HD superfamily hydrolase